MPNLRLYARVRTAFTAALAAAVVCGGSAASAHAQPAEPPPCAACLVLVITPAQALLVSEPLHGVEVLVRERHGA